MRNYDTFLSTVDNPFDPDPASNDYYKWWKWDETVSCCHCNEIIAVAVKMSDELSDEENSEQLESTIDDIIRNDFLHIYIKVTKPRTGEYLWDPKTHTYSPINK